MPVSGSKKGLLLFYVIDKNSEFKALKKTKELKNSKAVTVGF